MTDMNGNYILENIPSNATVEFSYIGYLQQSINVGNKSTLNVTLAEDTQKLDEVVVVGYGSFKKSDLTGAISQSRVTKYQDFLFEVPLTLCKVKWPV